MKFVSNDENPSSIALGYFIKEAKNLEYLELSPKFTWDDIRSSIGPIEERKKLNSVYLNGVLDRTSKGIQKVFNSNLSNINSIDLRNSSL